MKKGIALILLLSVCIVSLTACSAAEQYFVYGTILEVTVKGSGADKLTGEIADYIGGLEGVLSPTVEGSDLSRINAAGEGEAVTCSEVTMSILATCKKVYEASGGAYDPSVYPLVRLWQFSGDTFTAGLEKQPPTAAAIAENKALVGLTAAFAIDFEKRTVTKNVGYGGAMLDFGGVAKGYAADNARSLANGKQKVLVNLGGNITAANADYEIGIGNPREASTAYFGALTLRAGECISTSGDYERYYTYEGVRYHHVLDPSTGSPSDSGLISVSVISADGALGDAVSTAVLVLGKDRGTALLNELGLKAVLISSDLSYSVVGDINFSKK